MVLVYNTLMVLLASLQDNVTPRQENRFSFSGEGAGSTSLTAGSGIPALPCLISQQVNVRADITTVPEIVASFLLPGQELCSPVEP